MSAQMWLSAAVLSAAAVGAAAAEEDAVRLLRTPDLSPDGSTLVFSYAGDLWTVPSVGGRARLLTVHEAHDTYPVFSPDGQSVAFASNRAGNYDVYLIPAEGGRPVQLTHNSANDVPCAFSPDGKTVLFRSTREPGFPSGWDLYAVPIAGGTPRPVTRAGGTYGVFSPAGDRIAYVRGYESPSRRGYRGSANNEIWLCKSDGSENKRLTDFPGDDSSPCFTADGSAIVFVSDRSGSKNLWRTRLSDGRTEQLTHHAAGDVRRARISRDGRAVCYEFDGGVWVLRLDRPGERPAEARVTARIDDKTNPTVKLTMTAGASEMEVSPDNRQIALVLRGEVFVMPAEGGAPNRITEHAGNDHDVVWSPDGKRLVFVSDRDGLDQLYVAESADPRRPELFRSRKIKQTRLSASAEPEHGPQFSPDGKHILFMRAHDGLWLMDSAGKNARQLAKGARIYEAAWSPDSKWIAYVASDADYGTDVYVTTVGGTRTVNVTRWGTSHASVRWTLDGRHLVYAARHENNWNVYALPLQKPLAEGGTERRDGTVQIDFDDIHTRIRRVTSLTGDAQMPEPAPNGRSVALRSGTDLLLAPLDGSGLTRIAAGIGPSRVVWSRDGLRIWALDSNGAVRQVPVGGFGAVAAGANAAPATVGFRAEMEIDRAAEFAAVFRQAHRLLEDNFYDPAFHGADWAAVRDRYAALVGSVVMREDFYELMQEMLGELNASHLGISGATRPSGEKSGCLGLEFDPAHVGRGLKIKEVLRGGPCDRRGLDIKAGDFLLAVDGQPVGADRDLDKALLGTVGRPTVLSVASKPDPAAAKDIDVRPVDAQVISGLAYERWVARNASVVDMLSGGKLGYVHIAGMDVPSLERFKRELFSDMKGKAALVIDIRFNGGGFTHDSVLDLLGGKVHTLFKQRGAGDAGTVMRSWNRKWNKPALVMINERSASDAEIFPAAFRYLGLGRLVGRPTMGACIGTYNTRLIDGSTFRIPRLGVFTADERGRNLENTGVRPDYDVENAPDALFGGRDDQLAKAVEVLLAELDGKLPPPTPAAGTPVGRAPSGPGAVPGGNEP